MMYSRANYRPLPTKISHGTATHQWQRLERISLIFFSNFHNLE